MTILRGVQVGQSARPDHIKALADKGVTLVRYEICPEPNPSPEDWASRLHVYSMRLGEMAVACPKVKFVADLHRVPSVSGVPPHWAESAWQRLGARLNDLPNVIGYGILNEPPFGAEMTEAVMRRGWAATGAPDKKKPVLTYPHGDPPHFRGARPYRPLPKGWYECHMYLPMHLTHQGDVPGHNHPAGAKYPAMDGATVTFGRPHLERLLQPVINFAKRYRQKVYIGEFSISNFADEETRLNYLRDVIDIFEARAWHWTYHAMFESPIWEPSPKVLELLESYWKRGG